MVLTTLKLTKFFTQLGCHILILLVIVIAQCEQSSLPGSHQHTDQIFYRTAHYAMLYRAVTQIGSFTGVEKGRKDNAQIDYD